MVPRYPPFGKRMLQDNGTWLATLKRDNVDLVTEPIAAITPRGVRCADGAEYPVDVIVFATGFHANRFLWPMEIVGRDGVTLRERWGEEPRAYLGITVPGFPNLFCLYGPGTNLAHAGSIIFHSECQVRYVMGCLAALLRGGLAGHGLPPGGARRLRRALRRAPRDDGVVAPGNEQLVQERPRPRADDVAVAPGRLLALDQSAGARGLRAALTGRRTAPPAPPDPRHRLHRAKAQQHREATEPAARARRNGGGHSRLAVESVDFLGSALLLPLLPGEGRGEVIERFFSPPFLQRRKSLWRLLRRCRALRAHCSSPHLRPLLEGEEIGQEAAAGRTIDRLRTPPRTVTHLDLPPFRMS